MILSSFKKRVIVTVLLTTIACSFLVPSGAKAQAVPTNDIINNPKETGFFGLSFDALAWMVAKLAIRQLTKELVSYINNGFTVNGSSGNPGFLTDPQQFFGTIADQAAGTFIKSLGPVGQLGPLGDILCSPFSVNLRLSLKLNFGARSYRDQAKCTLTGVLANVKGAADNFVGGNFNQGGWNGWFELTQKPENNAFGASIKAEGALALQTASGKSINLAELNWGSGFLSFKKCVASNVDGGCFKYENSTPGALIEDQLAATFTSDIRNLELADELNEILGALGAQLIKSIFSKTGGGLSGASDDQGLQDYFNEDAGDFDHTFPPPPEIPGQCVPLKTENLALNKPAKESGLYNGNGDTGGPEAANDGLKRNCTNNGDCASISQATATEPNPWWEVDLATSSPAIKIDKINIYPRARRPLTDVYVFVSDSPIPTRRTPAQLASTTGIWSSFIDEVDSNPTTLNVGRGGRYIRVMRVGEEYLELVEVEVITTTTQNCPAPTPTPNPVPEPGPNPNPGNLPPMPSPSPIPANACQINPGNNIQSVIDGCTTGSVVFNPGSYNVGTTIRLKNNTKYLASDPAQVTITAPNGWAMEIRNGSNIWIEGMSFKNGRGINIEGGDGITVFRNVFDRMTGNIIVHIGSLYIKNSQVTGNRFLNSPNSDGVFSERPTKFEFVRLNKNSCSIVHECIHIFGSDYSKPPEAHDVEVNDNFVREAGRHALEIQDAFNRLEIARNDIADFNPKPGSGACAGGGFMGISQATGGSFNVKVHDNKVNGSGMRSNSDPTCFTAHEIIGKGTESYNNVFSNWGWGVLKYNSVFGGDNTPGSENIHDNRFCNVRRMESVPTGKGNTYQAASCL